MSLLFVDTARYSYYAPLRCLPLRATLLPFVVEMPCCHAVYCDAATRRLFMLMPDTIYTVIARSDMLHCHSCAALPLMLISLLMPLDADAAALARDTRFIELRETRAQDAEAIDDSYYALIIYAAMPCRLRFIAYFRRRHELTLYCHFHFRYFYLHYSVATPCHAAIRAMLLISMMIHYAVSLRCCRHDYATARYARCRVTPAATIAAAAAALILMPCHDDATPYFVIFTDC